MRTNWVFPSIFIHVILLIIPLFSTAQRPDLSKVHNDTEKVKNWLAYCETLKRAGTWSGTGVNTSGDKLQRVALEGLQLVPASDAENRARFFAYTAQGYYHESHINSDSVEYYFDQSLKEATKAQSAPLIMTAATALMHVGFELEEPGKVDSFKNLIQSIVDTTTDKAILKDGYSALGSYYQQKS